MPKILIHDRDSEFLKKLKETLESGGHWILIEPELAMLPNRVISHRPDLVIFNAEANTLSLKSFLSHLLTRSLGPNIGVGLMMESSNGEAIAKEIKNFDKGNQLFLLARNLDSIKGSIEKFLEKPSSTEGKGFLLYGPLELDQNLRAARLGASLVTKLPQKVFQVLWTLVKFSSETKDVCSRSFLIQRVWKRQVKDREVDVIISRMKTRLPFLINYIETIPGRGYRINLPTLSPVPPRKKAI